MLRIPTHYRKSLTSRQFRRFGQAVLLALVPALLSLSGCAALTNPLRHGCPVTQVPPEILAEPKEPMETIPLAYLRQRPPDEYRLAAGDVLGVYIEGVLPAGEPGNLDQGVPPTAPPPPINFSEDPNVPPSLGYPILIRENGTLPLPFVRQVNVDGMTLTEAEQAVFRAYTGGEKPILPMEKTILVTLVRKRTTRVLVIRQDFHSRQTTVRRAGQVRSTVRIDGGAEELLGGRREGFGATLDLPAYENDVLNALTRSGGLPGLEAVNEVIIQRGFLVGRNGETLPPVPGEPIAPQPFPMPVPEQPAQLQNGIVRIPLRMYPGQPPQFQPEDIILHQGDIVFVAAREAEVFYTGGLLPSGEFPLPRDYDLDVIEAVVQVGGPLLNGGLNSDNFSGAIVGQGIGNPSPKLLTVVRRTPWGDLMSIRVDLNEATRDPSQRLLVRPGDLLVLQETPEQAIVRYFTDIFFFDFVNDAFKRSRTLGTLNLTVP